MKIHHPASYGAQHHVSATASGDTTTRGTRVKGDRSHGRDPRANDRTSNPFSTDTDSKRDSRGCSHAEENEHTVRAQRGNHESCATRSRLDTSARSLAACAAYPDYLRRRSHTSAVRLSAAVGFGGRPGAVSSAERRFLTLGVSSGTS